LPGARRGRRLEAAHQDLAALHRPHEIHQRGAALQEVGARDLRLSGLGGRAHGGGHHLHRPAFEGEIDRHPPQRQAGERQLHLHRIGEREGSGVHAAGPDPHGPLHLLGEVDRQGAVLLVQVDQLEAGRPSIERGNQDPQPVRPAVAQPAGEEAAAVEGGRPGDLSLLDQDVGQVIAVEEEPDGPRRNRAGAGAPQEEGEEQETGGLHPPPLIGAFITPWPLALR
jgi:hypothetical protein